MITNKKTLFFLFAIVFLLINFLGSGIGFYTDFLWFQSLNFTGVFWTIFTTQIGIRVIVWIFFAVAIFANLYFTKNKVLSYIKQLKRDNDNNVIELNPNGSGGLLKLVGQKSLILVFIAISILMAFLFSSVGMASWEVVLKFLNASSFEVVDPLFGNDLGFYIFRLPFYQIMYQLVYALLVVNIFLSGLVYVLTSGVLTKGAKIANDFSISKQAKVHLSILFAFFFLLRSIGYRFDMYNLLYSESGVVFGAGYTDVNARMIAFRILIVISLAITALIITNLFINRTKWIAGGVAGLFIVSILLGNVYPAFVQQYRVEPNEYQREKEFIAHNIEFTRQAYGLQDIERRDFPVTEPSYDDILDNQQTIDNIRLWDHRALKDTYSQLQEIRTYYEFTDIDVDRYDLNGDRRQVMLSARELNQASLDDRAQTWVNRKLVFTHGFGAAMSPVNEITNDGMPKFLIKDIPPASDYFDITQPRLYYGELTGDYVITNTDTPEFDYPEGDSNKFYHYSGSGGVELNSPLRKLAFSLRYRTMKILLNDAITSESRLMFRRNIKERISQVAPFLTYDQDPYLAIDDNTGELYWIQDAYTTTDMYPYSESSSWGNYIRNSVKVVVNAYSGQLDYYIVDETDPLVETYDKMFPELFSDFDDMPSGLKDNMRYPVDLFQVQSAMYSVYHMEDTNVFYNREDVWSIPQENYAGRSITMEPYYTLMSLPGESEVEDFILMLPFTPANRNNIISWLGARSDPDNYGELVLYNFPKGRQIYGPSQIESRIDQHADISQQLSLWDQRGSRVIRGNLLVIPIANSLLYVEPIFLESDGNQIPELRKVIASFGSRIVMEDTLDLALLNLFDIEDVEDREEDIAEHFDDFVRPDAQLDDDLMDLINQVIELYASAQQDIQSGNWSEYGTKQEELDKKLSEIESRLENIQF